MKPITVAIADDHAVMRDGLSALIGSQEDMQVVGAAADATEIEALVRAKQPDIVIMDITMPDGSGIDAIPKVRQACDVTRVLVLTMHDDQAYLRSVMAAGGAGYVVKRAAGTELLTAIREVHHGRAYVNVALGDNGLRDVVQHQHAWRAGEDAPALSARETQVLELLAQGYTNREVAERLDVSKKTVDTYRVRIAEKLGLKTRADIVRYALETGMLK
jgi:two-component system, NarL family, response regulator NreC